MMDMKYGMFNVLVFVKMLVLILKALQYDV